MDSPIKRWSAPHRPGDDLCMCRECVLAWRIKYSTEPNTHYPDCSECYLKWNDIANEYLNSYCPDHPDPDIRVQELKKKNSRSAEEGTEYAFTLTMPPDHQPAIPLQEAAKKILEYGLTATKPYEKAIQYAYVLEHTEAGTPHVHGVYKTQSGRRISRPHLPARNGPPEWDFAH